MANEREVKVYFGLYHFFRSGIMDLDLSQNKKNSFSSFYSKTQVLLMQITLKLIK
jgi:hypothetical protein